MPDLGRGTGPAWRRLAGKVDGFLAVMLVAVGIALIWPALGAEKGPLHLGVLTPIGVSLVFFLHGAGLSPLALRAGAAHWRLHLLVQTTTFLIFPAIGALIWFTTEGFLPDGLRLGFFYLAALPSTISSSIAMTALARGNVAVAVFDATLSGLIGMIATPLLIGLVSRISGHGPSVIDAILDIMRTLLLPFALGQLCRPIIGDWVKRHKRITTMLDRGVIVLIVFLSFSESTASGLWNSFSLGTLLIVAGLAALMLLAAIAYTRTLSRWLNLDLADEAAVVFCGSKKSLANGAPMAKILFAGNPALGMIVLPILIYHQIQLLLCSQIARRYAAAATADTSPSDLSQKAFS